MMWKTLFFVCFVFHFFVYFMCEASSLYEPCGTCVHNHLKKEPKMFSASFKENKNTN